MKEWGLREVADQIETFDGEVLAWDLGLLGISEKAWNRTHHRGIKPILVFAHPAILQTISRAVSYYRMLAMVSQKSMNKIQLAVGRFESGKGFPGEVQALSVSFRLNQIISHLIETDEHIDQREFDLWRGMAAGSQAQGSWQNLKGKQSEILVKGFITRRLREKGFVQQENGEKLILKDGRHMEFADEPDIAIYLNHQIQVAIEIKGGIDTAGVLERIGAAIKSLRRAKEENPKALTLLLLQAVSVTQTAANDLAINQTSVNYWFTLEEFVQNEETRTNIFELLNI
ncbi:MAG TPA: XcyI family restriction endonuclease [Anaerolineales bacterium]|nr:XcyI family restriction endonuclease [Anaerolineales bacterium]